MKKWLLLIMTLILGCPGISWAAGIGADMVIFNGKILTADSPDPKNFSTAQAAAIFDGRFIAVGTNEEAMQYAGPQTRKVDLGGRTVLPGLVETHDHIYDNGAHFFPKDKPQVEMQVPPIAWTNKDDFLAQIRTIVLRKKPGEWIVTMPKGGAEMGIIVPLQDGSVTRFDLDKVTPDNPFVLHWAAMEEELVNTKALDALLARYPKIRGVVRDSKGVANGHLKGLANNTLRYDFWPQIPPEDLGPYYRMEMEELAAQGLTTVSTRLQPNHLAAYAWLNRRNELPLRMAYSLEALNRNPTVYATASRIVGLQGGGGNDIWGIGNDKLWMIGVALSNIDAVPGTGGSCVNKEYPREALNFPLWRYQFYGPHGMCTLIDPEFNDLDELRAAAKYGFRISGMHTGGDRGVDSFLSAVEDLTKQYPDIVNRRWSIDHCRFLNDEEANRAKKLNLMFSCGPKYLYSGNKGDIGAYKILYGEKTAEDVVVPLRRLVDHGLVVGIQLDQHAFHPFLALQVAVTRKDMTGKIWGPEQRVDRREALYMYTRWSSEYVLGEKRIGSIEPKKDADFVVLNQDYLTVPEDQIGRIDPVLTVMGGQITYSDPQFAASQNLPQVGYRGSRARWLRGGPGDKKTVAAPM